ncbi:probable global transcription activator SNF2L2 [Melanaphis sacchari]|uniref:probable global transcription activator SNF2L2 n=1 Tax=Melanaphis sacchari TaxID=742174 RepID=UPI000DC12D4C|nr:probable global transcription activator SNF2L2 [Melanaphis sacchari]
MADRVTQPTSTRKHRPSRGMLATHVEKLRKMADQLLREARRLSDDGPEDTVSGWSAERAATASFRRIRANPTAWALFERGFTEGRRSAREATPQHEIRLRVGTSGWVPSRRLASLYQRHDVRDRRGHFQLQQALAQPLIQQQQAPAQPPAQQQQQQQAPAQPPAQQQQQPTAVMQAPAPTTLPMPEVQLATVEKLIEEMEVTATMPST